ncbi:SDR family oxidoreductase [Salininema proteolyticum]|uniref:SDR family oxidoreductase n=1 Tax=Salininema proteolyticum TaxID=1607685 RepID=A0ABV8U0D8_9ACTN
MRVVIAGGHGKIARELEGLLSARGDSVAGIVRNPDHAADLAERGAETIVKDLEDTTPAALASDLEGADAVVFAAGAGPGSGVERKFTVDRDAAILLADAAERAGVERYVLVSVLGKYAYTAEQLADPVYGPYMDAKMEAEEDVRPRPGLKTTIVRPGRLTDDPATGRVRISDRTGRDSVTRADVAGVVLAVLDTPGTIGQTFEVVGGETPVTEAVAERA